MGESLIYPNLNELDGLDLILPSLYVIEFYEATNEGIRLARALEYVHYVQVLYTAGEFTINVVCLIQFTFHCDLQAIAQEWIYYP